MLALLQANLQNGFALAPETWARPCLNVLAFALDAVAASFVLVQVRGKMACLLINDIDAGLGHFANTQVRIDLSTCFCKHPHNFPSEIAL